MSVLLLAGSALLGTGSGRDAQRAATELPASPILTSAISSSLIPSSAKLSRPSKPDARAILGQLPLIFEPNQGQADTAVKFLAHGAGYSLFLDPTEAVLALRTAPKSGSKQSDTKSEAGEHFVRMKLVGGNPAAVTAGTGPLPGKSNYMLGNDPRKWHGGIPQFSGVRYASVYPGIDLVFYGNQGRLEYDFKVAPGADPSQAELQFDGANKLELSGGDLILTGFASDGKDEAGVRLQAPQIYQRDGDRREPVAGRFVLHAGNRVGFEIGAYDHSRELIIDPALDFSTYFGGNGAVTSPSIAVDGAGNIYIAATTTSATGFPGSGISTQIGTGNDVFVAKINPSQPPAVVYLTFLGGSGSDSSVGLGVDTRGFAYLVGNTTSTDLPTNGTNILGYQTTPETKGAQCAAPTVCTSVFVAVLPATGMAPLPYFSYLSGNGDDVASGMTIDQNGDVFVTGTTTSTDQPSLSPADDFPASFIPQPFQTQPISSIQFFVTKVNTAATGTSGIAYSTYFGGSQPAPPIAVGGGIAVDPTGNIYFSGTTNFYNSGQGAYGNGQSSDFPILNAYQPCLDTLPPVVLGVLNPCSNSTLSTPYPTDAFVAKLNPNGQAGTQLLFSTYFGGTATDSSTGIAIDSTAANIYITGSTNSTAFTLPTSTSTAAYQTCLNTPPPNVSPCPATTTNTDAYVARFGNPTVSTTGTPNAVPLTYFSYLGGGGNDSGLAIAILNGSNASTPLGDAEITGTTNSTNFPVTIPGAIQTTLNGTQNAYLAQIDTTATTGNNGVGSYVTYFGGNGVDRGTSLAVDTNQNTYMAGDTTSTTNLQLRNPLAGPGGTTFSGTQDAFVVKWGSAADLAIITSTVTPAGIVSAGNQVTSAFTIANQGPDPATNISVTGVASAGATFDSASAGSGTCSAVIDGSSAVCTIPTLQSGATSTVNFVVTPAASGNYSVIATVASSNNTSPNNPDTATATFQAGDYSMTINPSSRSVAAGQPTYYNIQLTPNPVFNGTVALSCGQLPGGAVCNFAPNSFTLNGPQGVTLNLTTVPQPVTTANSKTGRSPLYAFWLMVPGMALLGLRGGKGNGKKARVLALLALGVLFALVLLQPSCSSGKTQPTVAGTPTGTYSLTVTATSGSFSRSQGFSLTVTP
jgi:hypothetical protein